MRYHVRETPSNDRDLEELAEETEELKADRMPGGVTRGEAERARPPTNR